MEEVARLHGFHKIPVTLPEGRVSAAGKTRIQQAAGRAREILTAGGFWEVITYSFISPEALRKLRLRDGDRRLQALRIQNPLSEEQGVMRPTLLPGLLQTVGLNANRQNLDLKIFELGRVFYPRAGRELPDEIEVLSALLCGLRTEESWAQAKAEVDFFDLKGAVETLLTRLGVDGYQIIREEKEPFLHPGAGCRIEAAGEFPGLDGRDPSRGPRSLRTEAEDICFRARLFGGRRPDAPQENLQTLGPLSRCSSGSGLDRRRSGFGGRDSRRDPRGGQRFDHGRKNI